MKTRKNYAKILIWYLFGLMFFFAISSTMVGIVVEEIAKDYHLTYSQIGMLGSMQSVGGLIATTVGGMLSDRMSKKKLIGLVFAVFSIILCLMGVMPPYLLLVAYFLLIGLASNYLNLLISAYLPELVQNHLEFYMNMSHAFYGLGSLVGPLYSLMAMRLGLKWNQVFMVLGLICGVMLAFYAAAAKRTERATKKISEERPKQLQEILLNAGLLGISLVSLLYMGQQSVVNLWIVSYLGEIGCENGGFALSLYWAGVMAGRFLISFISRRIDSKRCLCTGCLLAGLLWIAALTFQNADFMFFCLCANGILTGAAFPVCISTACICEPQYTGIATSAVCLAGSIGGSVFTWLAGLLVEYGSHRIGLTIVPAVLFACVLLLVIINKKITAAA